MSQVFFSIFESAAMLLHPIWPGYTHMCRSEFRKLTEHVTHKLFDRWTFKLPDFINDKPMYHSTNTVAKLGHMEASPHHAIYLYKTSCNSTFCNLQRIRAYPTRNDAAVDYEMKCMKHHLFICGA